MSVEVKLRTLCRIAGYGTPEVLADTVRLDAISPGICMNQDCDFVVDVEGDQERGYCYECGTNTVTSLFVLAELI